MGLTLPTPKENYERLRRLPHVQRWADGDYTPGAWLTAPSTDQGGAWGSWGNSVAPNRRGISFSDLSRANGAGVPDTGPGLTVDRGGGAAPDQTRYEYQMHEKYECWSDNLESLLDEALSRQWYATTDIPWDKLEPLPPDQERALCQFVTFLHVVEFNPTDVIPCWMTRIDPAFSEARLFLATQCADESRHMEVFAKRLFANGGGPGVEPFAHAVTHPVPAHLMAVPQETLKLLQGKGPGYEFLQYNYQTQLLGESLVLDFFRFGEFLGRNPCDKEIFRRVLQDEARHVAYGTMHIKYYLEHAPKAERERALELLHYLAAASEAGGAGYDLLLNPNVMEPFVYLAAGSMDNIEQGWQYAREFWVKVVEEYLGRCERAGFPRWDTCLLPREAPF